MFPVQSKQVEREVANFTKPRHTPTKQSFSLFQTNQPE